MKKVFVVLMMMFSAVSAMAAFQYETKGNQGWITFDSDTTLAFDLTRSGKDKDHENFIDRGEGVVDYGWYNMETGESGSFNNGLSATFKENDRIGFYVKDNQGNTFVSTKEKYSPFDPDDWGKAHIVDGAVYLGGGNNGSNGTHEYYVFKINASEANKQAPSGQPLPGIIATLIVGGGALVYLKKRKQLYAAK
jgi:hypothetical protein